MRFFYFYLSSLPSIAAQRRTIGQIIRLFSHKYAVVKPNYLENIFRGIIRNVVKRPVKILVDGECFLYLLAQVGICNGL